LAEKEFLIRAIPMIDVDGDTNIPTVVFYEGKNRILIGSEAKAAASIRGREVINEDFKIDLGNDDPAFGKSKRQFPIATGDTKSAGEITGDFIDQVLRRVHEWFTSHNISTRAGIVIAEPLTMHSMAVMENWLGNYRSAIRRILLGKGFTKDNIDFLPEPFAVFQYYKYGIPQSVLGPSRQHVLVIDFGGGSFDVCIIATDKEGEVTGKRKNTKPLAASSAPFGGFYVNRKIAEALFFKYFSKRRDMVKKGLQVYQQWRQEGRDLSTFAADLSNFAHNFRNTIYEVEDPKLTLCKNIPSWKLDATLSTLSVSIRLPVDPFVSNSDYFNAQLTAAEFRDIFVSQVWRDKLETIVRQALHRGKEELGGAPITVVLLSGGSCNIKWLEELLAQDFAEDLEDGTIMPLSDDFQEVVAKGLAIECVRRYYDEDNVGDFTSVTYNRLHLILDPDGKGFQFKKFAPTKENPIPSTNSQCVLLPSASSLREQFDKPLTWRVRLDRPPHKQLFYYFLRSGFDPFANEEDDLQEENHYRKYSDDLLNLEQTRLSTPANCSFDPSVQVQLTIGRETKTAKARFIYKQGGGERESKCVECKPFYLDMTDTQDSPDTKAYIGLDFGTSNTSISYIDHSAIRTYQKRSVEKSWLDLKDIHGALPYPLASPLARYLSIEIDQSITVKLAREFIEAALAMAAYVSYLEMCARKRGGGTTLLGAFVQRSVGPLWKLLQNSLKELGADAVIAKPYQDLTSEMFFTEVGQAVNFFNKNKHELEKDEAFNPRIIRIFANVSQKVFSRYKFGYFENIQQGRFKSGEYKGLFRVASGSSTNFVESYAYTGRVSFPNKVAYLVNFESRQALPLQPLLVWYPCGQHPDNEHCYLYDRAESRKKLTEAFSYKAVGYPCNFIVSASHEELGPLVGELSSYLNSDPELELISF
jgi:molecular chaperone DnaK (HSP70)